MKKARIFIFFVVLVSIAIGGLLFLSTGDLSFIIHDKWATETTNAKTISLENSNEISINASSVNIKVTSEDRKDIKVNLISSKDSVSTYTKNNKMYIAVSPISNGNFFSGFGSSAKLEIIIPKTYSNELSVESSSGDIFLSNLSLSNLNCIASSGNVTMRELSISALSCSSVSGTINGTVITTMDSSFKSSSGNILLKKFSGNIVTRASSGDTKIDYTKFNNTITADASSGNVRLTLPKNSEFNLDTASSSGNINCSFPIEIKNSYKKKTLQGTVKNDNNKIYIRTSSGSITIND